LYNNNKANKTLLIYRGNALIAQYRKMLIFVKSQNKAFFILSELTE